MITGFVLRGRFEIPRKNLVAAILADGYQCDCVYGVCACWSQAVLMLRQYSSNEA